MVMAVVLVESMVNFMESVQVYLFECSSFTQVCASALASVKFVAAHSGRFGCSARGPVLCLCCAVREGGGGVGCRFIPSDSCPFGSPASSKGWLHRGETGIRGNTWRHLGDGAVAKYSGR